jgi:hypothetical protein
MWRASVKLCRTYLFCITANCNEGGEKLGGSGYGDDEMVVRRTMETEVWRVYIDR